MVLILTTESLSNISLSLIYFFFCCAQVQAREREIQHSRDTKEDFNSRLQDISKKVKLISLKLKQKAMDVEEAKEETEVQHEYSTALEAVVQTCPN